MEETLEERGWGGEQEGGPEQRAELWHAAQQPARPSAAPAAASERSMARQGLNLCCGAENEVPVIS